MRGLAASPLVESLVLRSEEVSSPLRVVAFEAYHPSCICMLCIIIPPEIRLFNRFLKGYHSTVGWRWDAIIEA